MSRVNIDSRDDQWLKENSNNLTGENLSQEDPEQPTQARADTTDEEAAPSESLTENVSTPMQNYLKHLYRLDLLTPEDEHTTTCLLRELEEKIIALLQKRGITLVDLRSEGVEQRGSTGAYDHGLIIAKTNELLETGKISQRDRSTLQNLMKRFKAQRKKLIQCNLRLVIAIAKRGMKHGGRAMVEDRGGSIVNVASFASYTGYRAASYAASKWGVRGLTQTAADELGSRGVRVNSVSPGFVSTPLTENAPNLVRSFSSATPVGRACEPADIAAAIVFLAADESSYVAGQDLLVDGGFLSNTIRDLRA